MNRSFIVAVLTVTMIMMMSTACYAIYGAHAVPCDNCHGKIAGRDTLAAAYRCLGCHNSMGEASRMPIEADALSNYFGSASTAMLKKQPKTGSRSSHTWLAGNPTHPDDPLFPVTYNPAAKVQEPTLNPALNSLTPTYGVKLKNTVLCSRCHAAKDGDWQTNTAPSFNSFLRVSNADDNLCLDCHLPRKKSDLVYGTHPVAYRSYSAVYKSSALYLGTMTNNSTAFRKRPVSANTYNPTANPGNYFDSKNKIICSTCHAPHYADSNSATYGNRSTANGFAGYSSSKGLKNVLQNSNGQLLRSDIYGLSASAINICSSCHKETRNINHNKSGQNVQCNNCHGAHVDFTGDSSLPNLELIRRNLTNMSGFNVKVIYNQATSLRFARADGQGICQACHYGKHAPKTEIGRHNDKSLKKDDCLDCHKHSNGFSAVDCTSCHGQPPTTNAEGGPNGKASALYTIDETKTPHVTHADKAYYHYECKNCHYPGTDLDTHAKGSFASIFIDTANSVGDIAGTAHRFKNVPADYDPGTMTCANIYCHSNGNPRGGSIAWKSLRTPSWNGGRNKIMTGNIRTECETCHNWGNGDALQDNISTHSHRKHVTINKFACNVCHAATVNQYSQIIDRTKHANGVKDVSFVLRPPNYLSVFSGSFDSDAATCLNSCHRNSNGGPPIRAANWAEPQANRGDAYCGSCHLAAPNTPVFGGSTTSTHFKHFTSLTGPRLGKTKSICSNCHAFTGESEILHANGVINLKSGNPCAPCHPNTAPVWTSANKLACESCHMGTASVITAGPPLNATYTAPLKNLYKSAGHGRYSTASSSIPVQCTDCHNRNASHLGANGSEKRLLTSGNALCDTCHTVASGKGLPADKVDMVSHGVSYSGTLNTFEHYTTTNDFRARDCAGCHDTHGTSNLNSIRTSINGQTIIFNNLSTGFFVTAANGSGIYNGLCQVCHTKTLHYRNNAPPSGPKEHYNRNCLNCHQHKGKLFAFKGVGGNCGDCHGYPPVRSMVGLGMSLINYSNAKLQDYSGGAGAHAVPGHIPKTARQNQEMTNCSNCHYRTFEDKTHATGPVPPQKANINVVVNPARKFNNDSTIRYNGTNCSNVSCHFKASPAWTSNQR